MRWLLLLVPLLGLAEFAAHLYFRDRAPRPEAYAATPALVDRLKQPGDRVAVAPAWAEPLVRQRLGDRMPISDLARADDDGARFVVELSVLGARAPELLGFREVARAESGPFLARRLENPDPQPALYRVLDHVNPGQLAVSLVVAGHETACAFDADARVSAGGLGGHVTYPRERFRCGESEAEFVGVTLIDDEDYRPRRCVYAQPPTFGALRLTFRDVPFGSTLVGHAGSSFLLARRDPESGVDLIARAGARELGRFRSRDDRGFQRFEFSTAPESGKTSDLSFELATAPPRDLDFCFTAETR